MSYLQLLEEGKKYFPYCRVINTITKSDSIPHDRVFTKLKNKGSYTIKGFEKAIIGEKLTKIANSLRNKGIFVQLSNTTNSLYFHYNDKNYRISDHDRNNTEIYHCKYTITYQTNEDYLVNIILSH